MAISFYRVNEKHGYMSNFSAHPIELDGEVWPTSEHYFQAHKYAGTPHQEEVRLAATPMEAARLGRDRARPLRGDWGDEELLEETSDDHYWGVGTSGTGKNMLGIISMEVRAALRTARGRT